MPRKETKPDPQKQLMIKTKACQRLIKEAAYYEIEVLENERQLQQMKDDNRDPYDIKKFREVLAESQMMIPDSICRRDKALEDLRDFVALMEKEEAGSGSSSELQGSEWMVEAKKLLGESGMSGGDAKVGDEGDVTLTAVDDLAEGEAF